jgi:hypothetical protein
LAEEKAALQEDLLASRTAHARPASPLR